MAPSTPKSPAAKPERPAKVAGPTAAKGPAKTAKPGKADSKTAPGVARQARPAAKAGAASAVKAGGKAAEAAKVASAKPDTDMVRLKDIVEGVAAATGLKKPEAKKAVEATLAAIGGALAQKSTLVVPPLGKLRLAKASAGVLTLKLRLADASRAKGLALAEDDEDS